MSKETAIDILEETVDTIENTLDIIENRGEDAIRAFPSEGLIRAGLFLGGLGIGFGVTYFVISKKIEKKYNELYEAESAEMREKLKVVPDAPEKQTSPSEFVRQNYVDDKEALYSPPVEDFDERTVDVSMSTDGGVTVSIEDITEEELAGVRDNGSGDRHNIWDNPGTIVDFDYDVETLTRTKERPYVISFEEFEEGRVGFDNGDFTFFAKDATLVDSRQEPIDDTENAVGDENLAKFGYGSKDRNVVYIRNERLEMDFTVIRSDGAYTEEVLGLRHFEDGDRQGLRKFRQPRE